PEIGNPDGYQKKGVRGEAKGIVVKTKGIANLAQIGTRRRGLRGNPGKSRVEQFEWSLITLVSVAWRLLLSQELFHKYSNELRKFVRTEEESKEGTHPLPKPKSQRMGHPGAFTHSFFDDSDRMRHPPGQAGSGMTGLCGAEEEADSEPAKRRRVRNDKYLCLA